MATRKRRRMPGQVEEALEKLADEGWTPAQIHADLLTRFAQSVVPTLRTVQRVVRERTPKDTSDVWSLANAQPGEARRILDVLASLAHVTDGRVGHITQREAGWILRIREAAPTLRAILAYYLAREYMVREDRHEDAADLDLYLAFAPQPGDSEEERRELAVAHAALHGRLYPRRSFRPWQLTTAEGIQAVTEAYCKAAEGGAQ